ncbi:OmpA family protein [Psychrobacter sp. NG25]|jgi:OOP family OmpA-OmpF porin|uniref:OmpA family protein n=1 Tax=Psychrobacter sp. NG25 TaxID=2782005 RepID=UPI001883648C|nr:OmpA family protein [Psychrobacter sp. NG25]MBF0658381.1 OmpA family protein [Psychrobacter sp. NG25]
MKVLSKILPSKLAGHSKKLLLVSAMILPLSAVVFAAQDDGLSRNVPVVIKGVVATSSDKQQLLEKLKAQYPNKTVRDEIEVRSNISIPTNWQQVATAIIDSDISNISQGRIDIHGTTISLHGKVSSLEQKQAIQNRIHTRLTDLYQLDNQLVVVEGEQRLLDDTLGNRIVEFESGSTTLTPMGLGILDDMAGVLQRVGDKPVTITGHTDNVGNPSSNLVLSNKRAEAVKQYLIGRNISAARLSTTGKGDADPIASNDNEEGRTRNRRIEFTLAE